MIHLKFKIILLASLVLFSFNEVKAQDIVLMRIVETEYRNSSRIVLTFPDKTSEIIPLESIVGSNARTDENRAKNQHTIAETMGRILEKGFRLDNVVKNILIFRMEES